MTDLLPRDRLQPSLLDRLIDDDPGKQTEGVDKRVLTLSRLRECVLRDLNWLFNATQLLTDEERERYPEVAASVVNYGLPPFSGKTASSLNVEDMERLLREAILRYEPRLLAESVRVRARQRVRSENQHNTLAFEIECQIWAQPAPLSLLLQSDLDLEDGQNVVKEVGLR
jgi:type VI secretion system protein ImpF